MNDPWLWWAAAQVAWGLLMFPAFMWWMSRSDWGRLDPLQIWLSGQFALVGVIAQAGGIGVFYFLFRLWLRYDDRRTSKALDRMARREALLASRT